MARFIQRAHIDLPLLVTVLLLAGLGLVVLYSAGGQDPGLLQRQAVRLAAGLVMLLVLAQVPPYLLRMWTPWIFLIGMLLLLAVLGLGVMGKGAQRWLSLGPVRFQPSEMMKIAVPMMIAWYLAEQPLPPRPGRLLAAVLMIAVPAVLIARQPDLGTALLIAASGFFVLYLAGLSLRLMVAGALAAIPAGWALWTFGMHDYQRRRVLTFLDPERDPLGAGYHIIQSKIALGSGGVYGKGWLNGTQSHLEFLPERSTDFIFAVYAEEFGLLGALLLLALYIALILRGLYITNQAQDTFTRLLAGSLTLTFFVYVFVNTGMVSGLLPVVGVPLPLVSYGGTSMVTLMAGFGILMSIHTHRRLLPT
ncbi:MAG: rod shape-determining protein RodA [Gammaproteobacteria bacterium]|nr:rod shape-determining protein RodA [Gammaproteobacteria bacterium]